MMIEKYSHELSWWHKALGIWRINKYSVDTHWGYFAPRFGLEFKVNRGGYFDQRYSICFCFIWGVFNIKLPFKTRIPESCDTPSYGFNISESTAMFYFGGKMNDWEQCDSVIKVWDIPFASWVFDWHKVMDKEGVMHPYVYESKVAEVETHQYTYKLSSGEVQKREATCFVEERQWHRKWFPFLKMNRRCIDISFSDEVGERSGSWKGGTIGCGYDMLPNETIEQCLRRMEKERVFN